MTFRFWGLHIIFLSIFFSASSQIPNFISTNSWEQVRKSGNGTIVVYWHESKPFIFKFKRQITGIEYEIMEGFKTFLKQKHNVDLQIVWQEAKSFNDTYTIIRDKKQLGSFGASAFSITAQRRTEVNFTPPYMSDVSVLITSKNVPIVKSTDEFNRLFSNLTAVTIKGTTYEKDILNIKRERKLPFKIKYIPSYQNILLTIENMDNAFGFIDLPVYLMIYNHNSSVNIKRQNLFPIKREGYSVIYPKNSDWNKIVNEYFKSDFFREGFEKMISKYLDLEIYHFIESFAIYSSNEEVVLLTKEKEIQYRDLLGKSQQIIEETQKRNFLIVLITVILIFSVMIFMLYHTQVKDHQLLIDQKRKIEAQQANIENQNLQLETRNQRLVALNEEKNNLIRILAHDLRTPINHVQGLAQVFLLDNKSLSEDNNNLINQIIRSAIRLNKMINNILDIDAIENDRINVFLEEISICQLMEQVVKSFEKQALKKNINLIFSKDNGVYVVKADSLLLIHIFENLLSNAIKFSDTSKEIQVTVNQTDNKVLIKVQDQGPGLTEEDKQMLFMKFKRLSAQPTNGERSTGLGLSIVKKYVEIMGGNVWCESQYGKGASFIVEFESSTFNNL